MRKKKKFSKWENYFKELSQQLIKIQKKKCCKYWMTMWVDKIAEAINDSEGGGSFNHCPECGKKFRHLQE